MHCCHWDKDCYKIGVDTVNLTKDIKMDLPKILKHLQIYRLKKLRPVYVVILRNVHVALLYIASIFVPSFFVSSDRSSCTDDGPPYIRGGNFFRF